MVLSDLCEIKKNFIDADFWIKKNEKDSFDVVTKQYNEEYIGIKVVRTDLILPDFLYYVMVYYQNKGIFRKLINSNDDILESSIKNLMFTQQ